MTTRTRPTPSQCLDLTIDHEPNNPRVAVSPVVGPPPIKQGLFNVPSGGVSTGGSLFGFFWTDHCLHEFDPQTCPGSDTLNRIGRGVLARYRDSDMKFVDPVPLPRDFVYATGVDATVLAGLPQEQRLGVYVFGCSGRIAAACRTSRMRRRAPWLIRRAGSSSSVAARMGNRHGPATTCGCGEARRRPRREDRTCSTPTSRADARPHGSPRNATSCFER